jgi:hypothetical protein
MKRYIRLAALAASIFAFGLQANAQTDSDRLVVAWSDSARPGTLDLKSNFGAVNVRAYAGREVIIEARTPANEVGTRGGRGGRGGSGRGGRGARGGRGSVANDSRSKGLVQLSKPVALTVDERNNILSIALPANAADLNIQVPPRTNLRVDKMGYGAVTIQGVDGDIEISSAAGPIQLIEVSGSVVAHSMAGDITASLSRVTPDRPMAFTAFAGNVDVTLPATVKANLILANNRGSISTDFDVQIQSRSVSVNAAAPSAGKLEPSIRGTVNGGGPDFELRTFAGNLYLRKRK